MVDLRGSLPTDDTDLDETTPDTVDIDLLRECMKGDEAFVEELQESLRPLCVLFRMHATLLNFCLVLDSGVMNGPGSTDSPISIGTGSPLLMAWQTPTSVGSIQMLIQTKHAIGPHPHLHDPRSQVTLLPQPLLSQTTTLYLKHQAPHMITQ